MFQVFEIVARINDRITPGKTININAAKRNTTPELSATNNSLQKKNQRLVSSAKHCLMTGCDATKLGETQCSVHGAAKKSFAACSHYCKY